MTNLPIVVRFTDTNIINIEPIGEWNLIKNLFYNLRPPNEDDKHAIIKGAALIYDGEGNLLDDEWGYCTLFDEELLALKYKNGKYSLEMGWYPQWDPNGCYEMQLIKDNDWDTSLIDYKTRDKDEMLKKIHETMQWVVDQEE